MSEAVKTAEAFSDTEPLGIRFAEEEQVIACAVHKRRHEFLTVRACARVALARLGISPVPILPGSRGAPQWPDGVVGSMTHCDGYRAAAVARAGDVLTIGIDAEPHVPLPAGVLRSVASPDEQRHVERLRSEHPLIHWDRLLFSAKESVYKAWFPLTLRWLDFAEAVVCSDAKTRTFNARVLVDAPEVAGRSLAMFDGRFLVERGLILTAVSVAAPVPRLD